MLRDMSSKLRQKKETWALYSRFLRQWKMQLETSLCTPTSHIKPSTVSGICMSGTTPKKDTKSGEPLLEHSQNLA